MTQPHCLRCGQGTALFLESFGSPASEQRFFCSTECAVHYATMMAIVADRTWCYWCEAWMHRTQGRCTACKQLTTEGREHAAAQGRG